MLLTRGRSCCSIFSLQALGHIQGSKGNLCHLVLWANSPHFHCPLPAEAPLNHPLLTCPDQDEKVAKKKNLTRMYEKELDMLLSMWTGPIIQQSELMMPPVFQSRDWAGPSTWNQCSGTFPVKYRTLDLLSCKNTWFYLELNLCYLTETHITSTLISA